MRSFAAVAIVVAALASDARAEIELKNDGFVSGDSASFQTGFVAGEAAAVRFVAPDAGRQLTKLQLLFGGSQVTQTLTLRVYDDTAGTDDPGGIQFEGDFELHGSDSGLQQLDLTPAAIYPPPQFRIALVFQHNGAPGVATDADGSIAADKNFILVNGTTWRRASSLGITGDFILRAFVSGDPPLPPPPVCDVDDDCADGTYCDDAHHVCDSDCHTSADCTGGATCSARGQCEGGSAPTSDDDSGCNAGGATSGWLLALALLLLRRRC